MTLEFEDFIEKYGTDTCTNFQLLKWSKDLGIEKMKYVMRNELQDLKKTAKYIIMNLDSSNNNGTHHTALYNSPDFNFFFLVMEIHLQKKY
jgi:hypothetical protein